MASQPIFEDIPSSECFDGKNYENNDVMIEDIKKCIKEFDWVKFYNSGKNLNGLIVISPYQTLIVYPLVRHAYGMDKLYNVLYGINISAGDSYEDVTNNITIRLVAGSSVQIQSFFPENITEYQKRQVDFLLGNLNKKLQEFVFYNEFDKSIFYSTYKDTINKLINVNVVKDLDKEIITDKIILGNINSERKGHR